MVTDRRIARYLGPAISAALILSACAKSTTPSSGGTSASQAPANEVTIGTGSDPKLGTILTNSQSLTLYLNTQEKGGTDACTGSCASAWPAVTVPSGGMWGVTSGSSAKKTMLATVTYGGKEVLTYNGYPLHTFSGDTAAGQTNGQGIGSIWFAVTPSGTAAGTNTSTSGANGTGGGGYGGGGY